MTPNGYQYKYTTPTPCAMCGESWREGGHLQCWCLWECRGKKVCKRCAREENILEGGDKSKKPKKAWYN